MTTSAQQWITAPLVALDLEGSGAQDRDDEAILEIAVVPLADGCPDAGAAYTTLVNPGRPIPRRPWISPGLTSAVLAAAPEPADVEPELARRLNGQIIIGHNVGVDWRLLHRRHPAIAPAGLIDTLRPARHLKISGKNSLAALTAHLRLTPEIDRLAAGSQHHRALWDTIAAALLLPALVSRAWRGGTTLADLMAVAAIDRRPRPQPHPSPARPGRTLRRRPLSARARRQSGRILGSGIEEQRRTRGDELSPYDAGRPCSAPGADGG
jgi:DNA polymerase III subunit epsilon